MQYLGQARFDLELEHPELHEATQDLLRVLQDIPIPAAREDDTRAEWILYIERARHLAQQAAATLLLTREWQYGRALALVRSAMEQMCLDLLMLTDAGAWSDEVEQDQVARDGPAALDQAGEPAWAVSPYARLLSEHTEAWTPGLSTERLAALEGRDADLQRRRSEEHSRRRRPFLGWRQIRDNLVACGALQDSQCQRLDDHYRFLSQFVHPYGGEQFLMQCYCAEVDDGTLHEKDHHIFGELVLLYLMNILSGELEAVTGYFEATPEQRLPETSRHRELVLRSRQLAGDLWFPPTGPALVDRILTANRIWLEHEEDPEAGVIVKEPQELMEREIDIEMNMFKRLHNLHQPQQWLGAGA